MSSNSLTNDANGAGDYDPTGEDKDQCDFLKASLTILVIGASGDLAKKMTFPSLFSLYKYGYLPESTQICGYARSQKEDDEFRDGLRENLDGKIRRRMSF